MNTDLLVTGVTIALIGMSVVLLFLVLMIGVMNITSKIIEFLNKIYPEEVKQEPKKPKKAASGDDEIALAIALAVHQNKSA